MPPLRAVEFFSGIGGFAEAASLFDIDVVAAFDQDAVANQVYQYNFGKAPCSRNLDSIQSADIPDADIWWMSPPCTPYSRRGQKLDVRDPRALSLLHLTDLLGKRLPPIVLVENVAAFRESEARKHLMGVLVENGCEVNEGELCPTMFGIPMKRPRYFLTAMRVSSNSFFSERAQHAVPLRRVERSVPLQRTPLRAFLDDEAHMELLLDQATLDRYGDSLNIIDRDDPEARAICFTSNYWKCMKAAGSFLREPNGSIRRFSDREMLSLFGFGSEFRFPEGLDMKSRVRLIGNSLDVRCVQHIVSSVVPPVGAQHAVPA